MQILTQKKNWIEFHYNDSYEVDFYIVDNNEELYLIEGWTPDNLLSQFQPRISSPMTEVSMESHLLEDTSGADMSIVKRMKE